MRIEPPIPADVLAAVRAPFAELGADAGDFLQSLTTIPTRRVSSPGRRSTWTVAPGCGADRGAVRDGGDYGADRSIEAPMDVAVSTKSSGSGQGLFLARRIMQAQGGGLSIRFDPVSQLVVVTIELSLEDQSSKGSRRGE